jgi:hypothetical protein
MKLVFFFLLLPIALLIAFVYASVWSAVFAAFLLSIGYGLIFKKPVKLLSISMRVMVLSGALYGAMFLGGLMGANEDVKTKIQLIEAELRSQNYHPKWVIISQKRSQYLNDLLANSTKESFHLKGLAIDLFVFDINNDGSYDNEDIKLLIAAIHTVEASHPNLRGGFFDYTLPKHGIVARHMVHIDTRGSRVQGSR